MTTAESGTSGTPARTIAPTVRPSVVFVGSGATLRSAARTMAHHDLGALAIVDHGTIVGILTERDVTRAIAAGADADAAPTGSWMTAPPITGHPTDPAIETSITMLLNHTTDLPVLGPDGTHDGYVGLADILLPLLHEEEGAGTRLPYMPPD